MQSLTESVKVLTGRLTCDMDLPDILDRDLSVLATENERGTSTWSDILLLLQKSSLKNTATKANENALGIHKHSIVLVRLHVLCGFLTLRMVLAIERFKGTLVFRCLPACTSGFHQRWVDVYR